MLARRLVTPTTLAVLLGLSFAGCSGSSAVLPRTSVAPAVVVPQLGDRAAPMRALVEGRLAALVAGDRAGWLAPLDGDRLRREQAAVFDRMRAMRVDDVRLAGPLEAVPVSPASITSGSAEPTWSWRVRAGFTYRIESVDTAVRSFTLDLTFVRDPDVRGGLVMAGSAPVDRSQPWDLAGLRVRWSPAGLVLATGSTARVDDVVARLATARAKVDDVWGSAHLAVVVAPATDVEAARLLGRDPATLAGIAAVTDGPLDAGGRSGADRIVLVPEPWQSLTREGRDVVLAHELTHVTVRAASSRGLLPVWLSEGFSEYVAYRGVDLAESRVVRPALDQVRREGLPADWPVDADFDPRGGRLPAAYGLALLAARAIADRHGQSHLVELVRVCSGDPAGSSVAEVLGSDPAAILDRGIGYALGSDQVTEQRAWRQRIADLLAR